MMHGQSKRKADILSEEEKKQQDDKAAKVLEMLGLFFKVRQNQIAAPEDPLAFTELMAKLCPEIGTIYNYRREILIKLINTKKDPLTPNNFEELVKIMKSEFLLINILLKRHPKSYTLWTHRQWTVLRCQEIDELQKQLNLELNPINAVQMEMDLCAKMLKLDERNFHVWNYRNWLTSISDSKQEELFTKSKIEQNFSNFSAYHFRSKYFLKQYNTFQSIQNRLSNMYQVQSLLPLPLEVLNQELELIQQAIYIQPKEHGIYLYHRWLLGVIQPFGLIGVVISENQTIQFLFNKNIRLLSKQFPLEILHNEQQINNFQFQNKNKKQNIYNLVFKDQLSDGDLQIILQNPLFQSASDESPMDEDSESKCFVPVKVNLVIKNQQLFLRSINISEEFQLLLKKIQDLNDENIKFIESVIQDEPNNRFPVVQLLYLLQNKINVLNIQQQKDSVQENIKISQSAIKYCEQLESIQKDHQAEYLRQVWLNNVDCYEKKKDFSGDEALNLLQQII